MVNAGISVTLVSLKVACAMRGRGESYENIKLELLSLNQNCEPPLTREEVLEIVDNVWNRY